ncbi:prephenate dehydrogenase [Brackiella oedipodis]|uniref:prephenate dehydrogenase n=1 Tax=Brackiella oedipodis TaxID=124225 RepID=UPI00048EE761|nr:prephenate dehydrogenase [Brackiella oedipodis]
MTDSDFINPLNLPLIETLGIVGLGLIGGSFAKAMRQANLCQEILAYDTDAQQLEAAHTAGVIDQIADIATLSKKADLIFLAVPVNAYEPILQHIKPHLQAGTLIVDAGSTKSQPLQTAKRVLQAQAGQFIAAHPMAGSHESGLQAARADLFLHRPFFITPSADNQSNDINLLRFLLAGLGAKVSEMDAQTHDRMFAAVSHLPHLISAAYMHAILQDAQAEQLLANAGTGFKDFTRIAASSAPLWRDVFFSNKQAVLAHLQVFKAQLEAAEQLLQNQQSDDFLDWYEAASKARADWQLQ